MRILVTGREGQLVQSLLERAKNHPDLEVRALGRPELDLEQPHRIEAALQGVEADLVINAAAYTAVDRAEDDSERAFAVNAEAAGALAGEAARMGARFVQISTDYVFDGSATGSYGETAPTAPLGVYGRSKLAGEEKVRKACPDATIVRTAWVYSPFGRNFVKTMLALAESRPEVTVVDDQRGSPTSALDIADGLLALAERWRNGGSEGLGGTYHLAGSGSASWAEFAAFIFSEAARLGLPAAGVTPIPSAAWKTRAERPGNSMLDSTRFERDFGYRAPDWRVSAADVVRRLAQTR